MNARDLLTAGWRCLRAAVLAFVLAAPAAAAAPAQQSFATADEAVSAMVEAIRKGDRKAFLRVIGPGSESWIFSGDAVADKAGFAKFIAAYDQKHALAAAGDGRQVLSVGTDSWPFPVPLVKAGERWRFDAPAGKEEVLARRIGRNELSTIQTMKAIVDAQREYVARDRDGDGLLEYAQKFRSTGGKTDGLYWEVKPLDPASPLGPLMARAQAEGYGGTAGESQPRPYHGYVYRMLRAQGKDAPGGAYDYMAKGSMIGGFAVIAWPVSYGASGIMTFLVNHDGVVHQKDLGAGTAQRAAQITRFNPDAGWTKVP